MPLENQLETSRKEIAGLKAARDEHASATLTGQRQTEEALRLSNTQLNQLLEYSPVVLYMLKLDGDKIIPQLVSANVTALLGVTVAETMSHEWWLGQLHPDDRARTINSIAETTWAGASRTEYRLRHKDGHYCWIHDARRLVRNPAGAPTGMVGVWADITERKRAEETVRQTSGRMPGSRKNKVRLELAIIILATVPVYLLAVRYNWFEAATRWILDSEVYQLDEIIFAILFLAAALAVFAFRRWRETESELTHGQQAQAALGLLHDELDRQVRQRTGELDRANQTLRTRP